MKRLSCYVLCYITLITPAKSYVCDDTGLCYSETLSELLQEPPDLITGNAGEGPTGCGGMTDPCVFVNKYGADLEIFALSDNVGFLEYAINDVENAVTGVEDAVYYVEDAIYGVESAIYYLEDGIINVESAVKSAELAVINVGKDLKAKIGNLDNTTQLGFQTNHTDLLAIKSAIFSRADNIVNAVDNASGRISMEVEDELRKTRISIGNENLKLLQQLATNQYKNTEVLNRQTQRLVDKITEHRELMGQKLTTEFMQTRSAIYDTRDGIKGRISTLINENKNNHNNLKEELNTLFEELYKKQKLNHQKLKELVDEQFCTDMDGDMHQTFICEVVDEQLNETVLRMEQQNAAALVSDVHRNELLTEVSARVSTLCTEDRPCFIRSDTMSEDDKKGIEEQFNYADFSDNIAQQLISSAQADSSLITNQTNNLTSDIAIGAGLEGEAVLPAVPLNTWAQSIAGIFPIFEQQGGGGCAVNFKIGKENIGIVHSGHFALFRDLLGWFFSFATLAYLFKLLLSVASTAQASTVTVLSRGL